MVGQTIQSRPNFFGIPALFLLLAAGMAVAAAVTENWHWAFAAVPFFLIGSALWLAREPNFVGHFGEHALEVMHPRASIPYQSIQGLYGKRGDPLKPSPLTYSIQLVHEQGVVWIPSRLNVSSDDIYAFLFRLLPESGARDINPLLGDYLKSQIETFGEHKVWSYRARRHIGYRSSSNARWVWLALFVSGVIWAVAGARMGRDYLGWFVLGANFAFWSLIISIAYHPNRQLGLSVRNWRDSGLVISPLGLALVQGELRGEMLWEELRELKIRHRGRMLASGESNRPGLYLHFEGAHVRIADIYDRPLWTIYERIKEYWR